MTSLSCNIIGLDQSLSHTAVQHLVGCVPGVWGPEKCEVTCTRSAIITEMQSGAKAKTRKRKPSAGAGLLLDHAVHRVDYISRRWAEILGAAEIAAGGPGKVYMEGYAMGSKFQREALGELGGQLKLIAYRRGWDLYVCAPMTLKKFCLGVGKGEKSIVMAHCRDKWGYLASDDNDCDAYVLARLGLAHQLTEFNLSKATRECLEKLTYYPSIQRSAA